MKKILIVLGVLVLLFVAIEYSPGRADFRAFEARREAWHVRCDAYIGQHASRKDPDIEAVCQRELDELVAYAERKGWTK